MGKPRDLRERAAASVVEGGLSRMKAAAVSEPFHPEKMRQFRIRANLKSSDPSSGIRF